MQQNSTNVMSTYELIATIIALVALIQPWLIKLWNTFFKKVRIAFIPSSKIKLYYNRSGAYIKIGGVIEAKNQAAVVKDISAKITRLSDNAELKMDWSSFIAPVCQSIAGNTVTTTETARPFKVMANDLYPVFVELANIDSNYLNRLEEIHNSLIAQARTIAGPTIPLEQAKAEFKKTSEYKKAKEELLESFYWKISQYILRITVSYGDNKVQDFFYEFSLDETEITEFKMDIERVMDCAIENLYGQVAVFYYPEKDYIEVEGSYAHT